MKPNDITHSKIEAKIALAEKILLPEGAFFNDERKNFIKNLDTIDLQAVPGSGKTTALLAKLLVLENFLPFDDGSGILVISHTNTAVNEIKNKIQKYCPKLFSYPNFVGTIQSFVDKFLAIPFYANEYNNRPNRIDNQIFEERITNFYNNTKNYKLKAWLDRNNGEELLKNLRFDVDQNLISGINKTPEQFPLKNKDTASYKALKRLKEYLLSNGYLAFDDAYYLANAYLQKYPNIIELLQKRFRFVFVDEMQDMDRHQFDLLENIFFDEGNSESKLQRIGDLNQAIHNNVSSDDCWIARDNFLRLQGSHRLTPEIANAVKYFGLNYQEIEGNRESIGLKPHIIVYDDPKDVLPKFKELITEHNLTDDKNPFCAVGWASEFKIFNKNTAEHKIGEFDYSKYVIKSYHPSFEKRQHSSQADNSLLVNYLNASQNLNSLKEDRNSILNAVIKVLRIEKVRDKNNKVFTTNRFIDFIRDTHPTKYEEFKQELYELCIGLRSNKDAISIFIEFLSSFLSDVFPELILSEKSNSFLRSFDTDPVQNEINASSINSSNTYENEGIKIQIKTIHSCKGETHTATLYLETYYQGNDAYESKRLQKQLNGETFSETKKYHIQSTKMMYVGCTRPSHLLCFAVHRDRYEGISDNGLWEIVHTY